MSRAVGPGRIKRNPDGKTATHYPLDPQASRGGASPRGSSSRPAASGGPMSYLPTGRAAGRPIGR